MKYAIIENNKVVNIAIATPEVAEERGWIDCPADVEPGYILDESGKFLPPPLNIESLSEAIRVERNHKLIESDIMVLPDHWNTMTDKEKQLWTDYRQTLRDIPQQPFFPNDIVWPVKP